MAFVENIFAKISPDSRILDVQSNTPLLMLWFQQQQQKQQNFARFDLEWERWRQKKTEKAFTLLFAILDRQHFEVNWNENKHLSCEKLFKIPAWKSTQPFSIYGTYMSSGHAYIPYSTLHIDFICRQPEPTSSYSINIHCELCVNCEKWRTVHLTLILYEPKVQSDIIQCDFIVAIN